MSLLLLTGGNGSNPTGAAPSNGLFGDDESGDDPCIIGERGGGAFEEREGGPMGPSILGLTGEPDEGTLKEEEGSDEWEETSHQGLERSLFEDEESITTLLEDWD